MRFDSSGIAMVKMGNSFFYHPVRLAQDALKYYGSYIVTGDKEAIRVFLMVANKLLDIQENNGAVPYNFRWRYYLTKKDYEPGWVSGMAQGQVLSVFSRAFHITQDRKWLLACKKTFRFMITPKEKGGVLVDLCDLDPSLERYIFIEEYISTPNNYTLNGYMFALLGIYDLLKLYEEVNYNSTVVKYYWQEGIKTLKKILPLYDIGGMSSYDLGHYTFPDKMPHVAARYHHVHIALLKVLASIVDESDFNTTAEKWSMYVVD